MDKVTQYKSYIKDKNKFCFSIENCTLCVFDDDKICSKTKFNNGFTTKYAKQKLSENNKTKNQKKIRERKTLII